MPPTFRFLHVTDRHCGAHDHQRSWETHRGQFFEDLKWCLDEHPLDAVFFTGDIANRAQIPEYLQATRNLCELHQVLMKRSVQRNHPIYLIVVPGNHDVVRQNKGRIEDARRIEAQKLLASAEERHRFSSNPFHPFREHIREFFSNYVDWAEQVHSQTKFEKPGSGDNLPLMFPGEGSYTIPIGPYRIGIIGLNSACLHFYDCKPKDLLITKQQVENVTKDPSVWHLHHQVHVLLTHHPVSWIHESEQIQTYLSQQFHLHLSGHMHESRGGVVRRFGARQDHYQLIGRSLISQRHFEIENGEKNNPLLYMGYTLGEIRFPELYTAPRADLCVMARRFFQSSDGHCLLASDPAISTEPVKNLPGTRHATTAPQPINFDSRVVQVTCKIVEDEITSTYFVQFDKAIPGKYLVYDYICPDGQIERTEIPIDQKPHPIRPTDLIDHPQTVDWVLIVYDDPRPLARNSGL